MHRSCFLGSFYNGCLVSTMPWICPKKKLRKIMCIALFCFRTVPVFFSLKSRFVTLLRSLMRLFYLSFLRKTKTPVDHLRWWKKAPRFSLSSPRRQKSIFTAFFSQTGTSSFFFLHTEPQPTRTSTPPRNIETAYRIHFSQLHVHMHRNLPNAHNQNIRHPYIRRTRHIPHILFLFYSYFGASSGL